MKLISQQYVRYFLVEKKFQKILVMFILLVLVIVTQVAELKRKNAVIEEARANQELIKRIPELEEAWAEIAPPPPEPEPAILVEEPVVEEAKLILQGIFIMDNVPHAIINGEQVQTGDIVERFLVQDITQHTVTLLNNVTYETEVLQFGSYSSP